ncbi:hypothetical protein OS190_07435 [Sulfitobacter sp. F26204]|nr:hypothetical protein [Sulfitobacter sp. F26204]MCX7559400.1 hypothetical protein [Sulfitobacter sp. F26204]
MKKFMIVSVVAALLAGCTPPEVAAPEVEEEPPIVPLSIKLPS